MPEDIVNLDLNKKILQEYKSIDISESIEKRLDRTIRHEKLVKYIAEILNLEGYALKKGNIDCLAVKKNVNLIIEVKTLDGSISDEIGQVRAAHAQLDYYEEFELSNSDANEKVYKIAFFENIINQKHIRFLQKHNKLVIFLNKEGALDIGKST